MSSKVKCSCGHSWSKSDSSKKDANVCHICGKDNTMKDGGWLDQYQEGGIEKGKNIKSTKTVDAGMLPEVTVVGSNDPQTEEFYRNILDNLPRDDSMGWYEGYMDLGKKYGFPKVHPIDKNSIIANIAKAQSFRKSKKPTPTYNPLTKTIESNDINKWVSEMSHHVQFKNNPTSTAFKALTKDLPINLLGKNPYKTPGTMEHEAHSIIEPQLRDEISQSVDSYYNLPYIDKKITEDMEYGLSRNFKFENGGWLEKYNDGGPVQPNYNDSNASAGPGFEGDGYSNVGRNYSPAWGGQFQDGGEIAQTGKKVPFDQWYKTVPKAKNDTINYNLRRAYELAPQKELDAFVKNPKAHLMTAYENPETGIYEFMKSKNHSTIQKELDFYNSKKGTDFRNSYDLDTTNDFYRYVPKKEMAMGGSLPGATGSMYARVGAPSKGKDRNKLYKTDASAENGKEMKFYQEGLDFKPKSISKNGSKIIKDDRGQWAHPGEITEIGSNQITMQGVPYPVMGISDTGDMQMMYPDQEYQYDGESVTEYPMMAQGGQLTKLDQLTNFTNYNTKQPGGWLDKYQ